MKLLIVDDEELTRTAVSYTHLDVYKRQVLCFPYSAFLETFLFPIAKDKVKSKKGHYKAHFF